MPGLWITASPGRFGFEGGDHPSPPLARQALGGKTDRGDAMRCGYFESRRASSWCCRFCLSRCRGLGFRAARDAANVSALCPKRRMCAVVAVFIAGSAIFIIFEATRRMVTPRAVDHADVGIAVMVFSIVLTIALVAFQRYVVRRTDSIAVGADALHYETDVLINASVIVSLVLSTWLGWHRADPLFGLVIAAYLLRGAWRIARRALDVLMDHEFADEDRDRISGIVLAHPRVKGMHDLRTRSSGVQPFIQLHLELDGDMPLSEAHEIADEVEARIKERYPGAEILIHQDPEGLIEEQPRFARS